MLYPPIHIRVAAAVEITHPEDSEYGAFDRSALTEDAISIVRNHVLTHGNLDITVQEVAAQLRDFLGSESPESSAIAARVLDVWQTKNAILHGTLHQPPLFAWSQGLFRGVAWPKGVQGRRVWCFRPKPWENFVFKPLCV